eukprot:5785177-Ditylum_brightwellii.AAC.1
MGGNGANTNRPTTHSCKHQRGERISGLETSSPPPHSTTTFDGKYATQPYMISRLIVSIPEKINSLTEFRAYIKRY